MVFVKSWPFFHLFLLGNIGHEIVFYVILERKNAFSDYKNKKFKKSKNWDFTIGVNPWFAQKLAIFPCFSFSNIGHDIVFYDILKGKNAFLDYKNNKFKKSKNWDFSKGVNPWVWSKIGHFSIFFFRQYRPGKCVLRYSRTKKRLSRL